MKLLHAVENGSWWKAQGARPTGRESLEVKSQTQSLISDLDHGEIQNQN